MVLFSGDFDKVFAAFIIASGALAMGKEVSMFVTFWGLDAIKKPEMKTTGRQLLEKMVLWMRPKGPLKLRTSKMNFGGIGPRLFRYMMGQKERRTPFVLIEMSRELGIRSSPARCQWTSWVSKKRICSMGSRSAVRQRS